MHLLRMYPHVPEVNQKKSSHTVHPIHVCEIMESINNLLVEFSWLKNSDIIKLSGPRNFCEQQFDHIIRADKEI